jgi:hypothetical protein
VLAHRTGYAPKEGKRTTDGGEDHQPGDEDVVLHLDLLSRAGIVVAATRTSQPVDTRISRR